MNDDDQLNDNENGGGAKGGFGPLGGVGNTAKTVQDVSGAGAKHFEKSAQRYEKMAEKSKGKTAEMFRRRAEKQKKKAGFLSKVSQKAGKIANIAAKLGHILACVAFVIIVIIALIGLITFILTGFGFIMGGLQKVVNEFFAVFQSAWNGKESIVSEQSVIDTVGYLEEMGYDLYGYGFVTEPDAVTTETDDSGITTRKLNYETKNDAYRYIVSYLISDNYANCIKNDNKNFKAAFETLGGFFSGLFGDKTNWGSGLISVYHEKHAELGKKGDAYGGLKDLTSKAIVENGSLRIESPGLVNDVVLEYKLDGWTGRYGMPLEFLLATHIATMAPDLSYKMVNTFDTDIQILLHPSKHGYIDAGAVVNGNRTTKDDFADIAKLPTWGSKIFEGIYDVVENLSVSNKDAILIFQKTGITPYNGDNSSYKCGEIKKQEQLAARAEAGEDISEEEPIIICSAKDPSTDEACTECTRYVKEILQALNDTKVTDFETYVPYINKVTNHWYRNVYFTAEAIKSEDDTIIQTDVEYEKQKGERWTLYEKDSNEQYILYVYLKDSNGEYKTDLSDIVCKNVGEGNGDYDLSDDGVTYVKKSGGKYKLQKKNGDSYSDYSGSVEEFRVGKKAVKNTEIDDDFTAYEFGEREGEWQDLEITTDSPQSIQNVNNLGVTIQYRPSYPTVKQIEDGVRGETNSKIKKLFLDEYYIYDGTGPTAALIQKAKEMAGSDDPDDFRAKVKNKQIEDKITAEYKRNDGDEAQTYTATIDQISSSISLTHTSLSAFSILENMRTLDAEYIYHDFKELVVELDYFDKEDLVEAESEVMMFPISGVSSAGWPEVRYDKLENYSGTLIQSAEDLEAQRARTQAELAEILKDEYDNQDDVTVSNTVANNTGTSNASTPITAAANDMLKYMAENEYFYCRLANGEDSTWRGKGNAGHSDGHGLNNSFEESKTGYKHACCATIVSWALQETGYWDKCIHGAQEVFDAITGTELAPGAQLQEGDIVLWNGGGHVNIYAGKDSAGNDLWYDTGGTTSIRAGGPVTRGSGWDKAKRIDQSSLQYNGISGLSGTSNAEFQGFQGEENVLAPVTGEVIKYGVTSRKNFHTGEDEEVGFIKILVLNTAKPGEESTYFVDEHKTVKDSEKDKYKENKLTISDWLDTKYTDDELKVLGYDYFWEEYDEAGITDNVLYIEGFDVSEILGSDIKADDENNDERNAGENITKLAEYIENHSDQNCYSTAYRVPNLVDDRRELELRIQEQAKKDAVYTVTKHSTVTEDGETKEVDRIFIKEGAIIGKTYKSDDVGKDVEIEVLDGENTKTQTYKMGNYLKMILRDTAEQAVENVEAYVEKKTSQGIASQFPEEFLYWEGVFVEGGITTSGDYYESFHLKDGKTTTAFGLTEDCNDTALKLGYSNYLPCLFGGKVPISMAQDIFIAEMEKDREAVLKKAKEGSLSESGLDALVSIYHNSPARALNLIEKLNSSGQLTEQDFVDQWGSNTEYEDALKKRRRGEYKLYSEGIYVDYKSDGSGFPVANFKTQTPWTDFCSGKSKSDIVSWSR